MASLHGRGWGSVLKYLAGVAVLLLLANPFGPAARAVGAAPGAGLSAQTDKRCFSETGFCIQGRIREYWEQNGGLDVFGYPTTDQHVETVEGKPYQVQWFERNRLELHPENAQPYDVLLGRLGADRLGQQNRDWNGFPKSLQAASCQYFAQTGHSICEPFLTYFRTHGLNFHNGSTRTFDENLALFGLPLDDPEVETNSSGDRVLTQWFERARMEYHPGNEPRYQVLLGLLGNEVRNPAGPDPQPGSDLANLPDQWLARLNAYRAAADVPLVVEDPALSAAAAKHVAYILLNPDAPLLHDETPGAAGYSPEGQQSAKNGNLFKSTLGFKAPDAIDNWMDSLKHRFGILRPELVRTGFAFACDANGCAAVLDVLTGLSGVYRPPGVAFPGPGTRGVATQFVTWQAGSFDAPLQVTSATVRDAQGNQVPVTVTPPDGPWNAVEIAPVHALASGTQYTVSISGTQGGKPLSPAWSFTTK